MTTTENRLHTLLRASEKYFKTDMVYLASGGMWYMLGTLLSLLISLGTALAFANLIPKETYGAYQYILSITDIFGILMLGGIDSALTRSVARGQEGSLFDALRAKIRWGLLGGAGSAIFGAYYLLHGNPLFGGAFIIAGMAIPFWETPGIYAVYLQGKKEFYYTNAYGVATQFIAALVIVPTLYFSKNLLVILAAYLVSWGLARTFFFYLAVKKFPPNKERDPGMIRYGKHITVMSAASSISGNVDTILLWHLLGPAAVAVYVFAQTMPLKIAGISKIANRIAFPKMAAREHETLQKTLPPKILPLCLLAAMLTAAYIIAAPFIFAIFFPQYREAVPFTQILSILVVLQPFSLLASSLAAQAKQKALYIYNLGVPLVRIALFLLLIPPFHLWGAVAALILIKTFDTGLLVALFYRA